MLQSRSSRTPRWSTSRGWCSRTSSWFPRKTHKKGRFALIRGSLWVKWCARGIWASNTVAIPGSRLSCTLCPRNLPEKRISSSGSPLLFWKAPSNRKTVRGCPRRLSLVHWLAEHSILQLEFLSPIVRSKFYFFAENFQVSFCHALALF